MAQERKGEVKFGEQLSRGAHIVRSAFTSGPSIVWVTIFLIAPLVVVAAISIMSRGEYGEVKFPITFENYKRFAGFGAFGFDPLYPVIILRSLVLGAGTALLCLLAAVPLAFFIGAMPPKYKNLALTLVVIPFWTNLLIRTYAWQILLAPHSLLAKLACGLGMLEEGRALYPGVFAVYVGMVCDYLPFLVLPLYSSVEKIDWSIAEAAMDLGADSKRVFWHAVLPQIMPGLIAGTILVLIPATGQFVIPDLLGGAKTAMLGNAIDQTFRQSRDWPFGSAIACLGVGVMMFGLWVYARMVAKRGGEALL